MNAQNMNSTNAWPDWLRPVDIHLCINLIAGTYLSKAGLNGSFRNAVLVVKVYVLFGKYIPTGVSSFRPVVKDITTVSP